MDSWDILDRYFQDHAYPFTQHHLDSFREFLRTHLPATIASYNPITMIKNHDDGTERLRVEVFVGTGGGGLPADASSAAAASSATSPTGLYIDRPTLLDADGAAILLTPQEARLRHLTYQTHLSADITVRFTHEDGRKTTKQFPRTLIAALPIMVHSDPCVLHDQGTGALRELGECPNDPGGYFIIDGKEKVIISQERLTTNRLFIAKLTDDQNYSYSAAIRCTGTAGETALIPRTVNFYLVKTPDPLTDPREIAARVEATAAAEAAAGTDLDEAVSAALLSAQQVTAEHRRLKGAILVSLPSVKGKVPLFTLFRALGVESDKEILEHIVGPVDDPRHPVPDAYLDFLRPSMASAHYPDPTGAATGAAAATEPIYTQSAALEYLRRRVFYESTYHVKTLLVSEVFPNIGGAFSNKARFLGYLVGEFMRTALGIEAPSDRDSYLFKRVDISGFLLAQLFQETYNRFRKNCRNMLDHDYNYGPWKNSGNLDDLVNPYNLHKLFDPVLISETFQKSLKGMWGPPTDDPDEGLVQDLARVSYIGSLSHLRRVNLPLDRSIKVTSPHRLHAQQWGIMCPFESPDGASIGYLKNFAMLTHITFGTDPAPVRDALLDLGVLPLNQVTPARAALATAHGASDATLVRVFVNGDWFGLVRDPVALCDRFRLFRRNGLLNPFVSITWDIKNHTIRVLTEPGRPCRPLLIGNPTAARAALAAAAPAAASWFDLLFGTYLDKSRRTDARYYSGDYIAPEATFPFPESLFDALRKTQGVLEFLDIEEANTMLFALADAEAETPKPRATHTEIHPVTLFSVVTNNIPLANHNFAPRNCFYGAQSKQAIGVYATSFNRRFDTVAYLQHYPQKPLVTTRGAHYVGNDRMPNGFNAIVAVATYSGFNQEDGLIINRAAIDRGLFQITKYKTLSASEKIVSDHEKTVFANPVALRDAGKAVGGIQRANYSLLTDAGFIPEGAKIPRGQEAAVVGMVHIRDTLTEQREGVLAEQVIKTTYTDVSKTTDVHHYGTVDRVFVGTRGLGADKQRVCKVRFRKVRRPELGDKSCCYDAATEVLTARGWLPWADLRDDDQVASLRRADGALDYVRPTRIFRYDHDGLMYTLENSQINLCVTPNHRLYVTDALAAATDPAAADPGPAPTLVEARDTEGTTFIHYKNARRTLFTERPPAAGAIAELANIHWRTSLADGLPAWVWRLTMADADALLHAMFASSLLGQPDSIMTSYKRLADDLQRLALHAGQSATIDASDAGAPALYTVTLHRGADNNQVVVPHGPLTESGALKWTPYAGPVYCCETPETHGVVYVRRNGRPIWCGNSRCAQKGVFGMILPPEAMPFTKDGIIPDIIMNPHAFPSRMTIAHLIECVFAKLCALQGQIGDATVFLPFDQEAMYDSLGTTGFERHGNEILYNGRTGEQIQTEIFVGPTFYLRLKHMVADKVHARPTGPRDQLTRQPTSGRSKLGGLRIGEMEHDVLLSHGMSQFTKETFLERSDKYTWTVCRHCGILTPSVRRGAGAAPTPAPTACNSCGNVNPVVVQTPYAFKLLVQELEPMGIQVRLSSDALPGALPYDTDDDDAPATTAPLAGGDGCDDPPGNLFAVPPSAPGTGTNKGGNDECDAEAADADADAEATEAAEAADAEATEAAEAAYDDANGAPFAEENGVDSAAATAEDAACSEDDSECEDAATPEELGEELGEAKEQAEATKEEAVGSFFGGRGKKKTRPSVPLTPPPEITLKAPDAADATDGGGAATEARRMTASTNVSAFVGGIGRLGAGADADDRAPQEPEKRVIEIRTGGRGGAGGGYREPTADFDDDEADDDGGADDDFFAE